MNACPIIEYKNSLTKARLTICRDRHYGMIKTISLKEKWRDLQRLDTLPRKIYIFLYMIVFQNLSYMI